jgi:hypothetical protein
MKQAASGNQNQRYKQLELFAHDNDKAQPEWVEIDTANVTVTVENELDFGGPWLALKLIESLKLDKLFEDVISTGREDIPWSKIAMILVICRLCNPSSELYVAEHYYKITALAELLGVH